MTAKPLARLRSRFYACSALAITGLTICLTCPTQARAQNLVDNGGFENLTATPNGASTVFGNLCEPNKLTAGETPVCPSTSPVVGWTGKGLLAVFKPGPGTSGTTADTTGATWKTFFSGAPNTTASTGAFRVWGPGTTNVPGGNCPAPTCNAQNVMNGLTLSPVGGNFIALDGDFNGGPGSGNTGCDLFPASNCRSLYQGSISQHIGTALTVGKMYDVTFYWSTAQQTARNAPSGMVQQLLVGLCPTGTAAATNTSTLGPVNGGPSGTGCGIYTTRRNTLDHGSLPWVKETFAFKALNSSETLSFLALGTPSGLPPVVLLDGVSMTAEQEVIPEPSTWLLLGIGFAAIAGIAYRRPQWLGVPA